MNTKDILIAAKALRIDGSPDQPRDESGRWTAGATTERIVRVHGNTYPHKEALKAAGYKWQPDNKVWEKQSQVPDNLPHTSESFKLPEGHPDRMAHREARLAAFGKVMFKGVAVSSARPGGLFTEHYKGTEYPEAKASNPDRGERNRAMHIALGHSGYKRIPGSAPDDTH